MSEIAQVAAKHGFGYAYEAQPLHIRRRKAPVAEDAGSPRGVRLREMLDELGPTFVKFGQLLSTRPDVVPPDIVFELKKLQDDVSPFPFEQVEQVVEEELNLRLAQLFVEFDETPVAAASIGQVHRATLPNNHRVAVKVQRPNAPAQVEADIDLMYQAAEVLKERVKALEFIDTVAVVDEFARTIRAELDYRREARNAEQFRRNFTGHSNVQVPKVYSSYSRGRVLTLELLDGIQLRDLELGEYSADQRRRLATVMTDAWMAMIFRHGFFHGDPHPSNVMVLNSVDEIGLLDFGMTGSLSADDMTKITSLFIDAVNQNVDALPRRLADLGVHYPQDMEDEFREELRDVYYRYYGASLQELDPIELIREAFALIYKMRLHLPTRFVLLDRAIATLGSVGVELYPDFNVFEVAKPYARDLMIERFTPRRMALRAQHEARNYARIAAEAPYQIHDILEEFRDGEIEIGFRHQGLDDLFDRIDRVFNRLVVALLAAAGVVGSAILAIFLEGQTEIFGIPLIAGLGFIASFLLGVWLVVGVIRSGRI